MAQNRVAPLSIAELRKVHEIKRTFSGRIAKMSSPMSPAKPAKPGLPQKSSNATKRRAVTAEKNHGSKTVGICSEPFDSNLLFDFD